MAQDVLARTAENKLAQPRMAVTSHDQQIGAVVLRDREQCRADVGVRPHGLGRFTLHAVTGKRRTNIRRRNILGELALGLRVDLIRPLLTWALADLPCRWAAVPRRSNAAAPATHEEASLTPIKVTRRGGK